MPARSVAILLGTRKGAFLLRSSARRERWRLEGPHFEGTEVNHLTLDSRTEPTLYAALNSPWWGSGVRMSTDLGTTWTEPEVGIRFAEDSGLTVVKLWQITLGSASQPGVVYAGVDPAALFASTDSGRTWADVPALTSYSTRDRWAPGAGGMMVDSIVPHPSNLSRMHIAISAASTFETTDGGATWEPRNKGVLADFMLEPDQYPEVGQCVHHLEANPTIPRCCTSRTTAVCTAATTAAAIGPTSAPDCRRASASRFSSTRIRATRSSRYRSRGRRCERPPVRGLRSTAAATVERSGSGSRRGYRASRHRRPTRTA